MVIDERELSGARVAEVVAALLADPARLDAMGEAMRRLAKPDAAALIVARILELAA
jgi:UDP-N-acetylglucosamine:LPS N-acetylglucosamine transferase